MKKILFPAAFAAALLSAMILTSCKKSDDGDQSRAAMIVGTWTAYQVGEDVNGNGTWDTDERAPATGSEMGNATFNADGSGNANINFGGMPFSVPLKWNLQNGDNDFRAILSTPIGEKTLVENIVKLTSSDLEFRDSTTTPPSYTSFKKQ